MTMLLACTIKISILVAAAWLATRILRNASAATRHAVWAGCLIGALVLPFLIFSLPPWDPGIAPTPPEATRQGAPQRTINGIAAAPFLITAIATVQPLASTETLLAIWAAGSLLCLTTLTLGLFRLIRAAADSRLLHRQDWVTIVAEISSDIGLQTPVLLLMNKRASMPVTWGLFTPRIMLPSEAETWSAERIRVVLSHELSHIHRRDWAIQMAGELCRSIYWFNPLIWFACSHLRRESEQACDDAVLRGGFTGETYAEHLLELARKFSTSQRPWSVALAVARSSNLERRFVSMLNPTIRRGGLSRGAALITTIAAAAILIPLAAMQAPGQTSSGTFEGRVVEASGALVPAATVIVSNPEARTRDMTATNAEGVFQFAALPPGNYTVEILKPGFERLTQRGVALQAGTPRSDSYSLRVGMITENIQVVGDGVSGAQPIQGQTPSSIKIGGMVQAAKLIHKVTPPYPPQAKAAGSQGIVLLDAVISREGVPLGLRIANAHVDAELGKAAVEAVSQWRYQPTLLNGEPVEIVTQVAVNFTLAP